MASSDDTPRDKAHARPDGGAWQVEMRRISDRNDEARKTSRAQRTAHDKWIADLKRAGHEGGPIYR